MSLEIYIKLDLKVLLPLDNEDGQLNLIGGNKNG